jgi:hypothetical protein
MTLPASKTLLPLAQEMLTAAYTHLFTEGKIMEREAWAAASGHGRAVVGNAVEDLRGRNLVNPAGGRVRMTTLGVERVERHAQTDADLAALIALQFALRRRILQALEDRRADAEAAGGLSADQIATVVGEARERVTPSLLVLRDRFLLQAEVPSGAPEVQTEAGAPLTFRISQTGRRALQAAQPGWPLAAGSEGTGDRRSGDAT